MRFPVLLIAAAVLTGCGKTEPQPAAEAAAPVALALADVAGKWSVRGMQLNGDSVLVTYELVATADTAGWTMTFPGRPAVPMRVVAVAGDSVVAEAGPYESVLRKGATVTVSSVNRLRDGKLVGTFTAHYANAGPDSVMLGRSEGTRLP